MRYTRARELALQDQSGRIWVGMFSSNLGILRTHIDDLINKSSNSIELILLRLIMNDQQIV